MTLGFTFNSHTLLFSFRPMGRLLLNIVLCQYITMPYCAVLKGCILKINKLINRSLLPPDLRFSMLATVLILAGCSTAPDNTLSHIKRADELASSQSLTTAKEGRWPDAQWWLRYHDRQFDSLTETALASAPTLKIADSRLKNAAGIAEQIGAISSVQVGASASASKSKVSYAYHAYMPPHDWNDHGSATANLSFNLDFWVKNRAEVAAATSDYAAAGAEMHSAKLLLQAALVQSYAELARLYLNRDTTQNALEIRSKTFELMTERNLNGLETDGVVKQV
ncbi:TolC family protein [Candidatus Symbiopectobacterium sp.]|uniref:TolC family protein n=1 Tax=Candidatus Symbiopectobacterium sp. TaxID=2816440 RepID=UPI0025BE86FF|nr:TolC family protein [Candidatus Symbiopectobacterium sp.]